MDAAKFACNASKSEHSDVTDLIPLYDRELSQKKFKELLLVGQEKARSSRSKRICAARNAPPETTKNSYLKMFYSKLEYNTKFKADSYRCLSCPECATSGGGSDKREPTQNTPENGSAILQEELDDDDSEGEKTDKDDFQSAPCVVAPSNALNPSKFCAMSYNNLNAKPILGKVRKKPQIKCPAMTNLGPDLSEAKKKYEIFKKRQEYGLKASQRNRIKAAELNKLQRIKEK